MKNIKFVANSNCWSDKKNVEFSQKVVRPSKIFSDYYFFVWGWLVQMVIPW